MRVEFVSINYMHPRHAVSTLFLLLLGLLAWLLSSLVLIVLTRWLVGNLWEPLGLDFRSAPGELWLAQSQVRVWGAVAGPESGQGLGSCGSGPESGQGLEAERSPRCSPQSKAGENLGRM